jgi:hypothetical protein
VAKQALQQSGEAELSSSENPEKPKSGEKKTQDSQTGRQITVEDTDKVIDLKPKNGLKTKFGSQENLPSGPLTGLKSTSPTDLLIV